jgi:putative membrane protein
MGVQKLMADKLTKNLHIAAVISFCGFLAGWAVFAHQANSSETDSNQHKSMNKSSSSAAADQTFVKKAGQGGMAEVKLGELAGAKGTNDNVKNFGKRMVNDHSKANQELKEVASKGNLPLPIDLDPKDQAKYDNLAKLSGPAFDKAYAREMVRDHEKDVAEFRKEASSGRNEDVKNFAAQTLPTLEDHLKEARQMMQSISGASARQKSNSDNSGQAQK